MRFRSAGLGLALLLGCTAKSPLPAADQSEPEIVIPVGALVVVRNDATVYREREDPTGVTLRVPADASGRGYAVEVLSVVDSRLEVRTLGPEHPPTCAGNFRHADDFELRFWVDRADLHQLLVAPATFEFGSGTKLELSPGVLVLDEARGELGVGTHLLFVDLADAEIGLTYDPPALVELDPDRKTWSVRTDTLLHYGDRRYVSAAAPFDRTREVLEIDDSSGAERLLVFEHACGRFTLRGPESSLTRVSSLADGPYATKGPKDALPRLQRNFDPEMAARAAGILDFAPRCTPPRWRIASGVALSWADGGRPAGTVRRAHQLPKDARELGDRVCFDLVEGLGVCAEASKLARTGDPDCEDAE